MPLGVGEHRAHKLEHEEIGTFTQAAEATDPSRGENGWAGTCILGLATERSRISTDTRVPAKMPYWTSQKQNRNVTQRGSKSSPGREPSGWLKPPGDPLTPLTGHAGSEACQPHPSQPGGGAET